MFRLRLFILIVPAMMLTLTSSSAGQTPPTAEFDLNQARGTGELPAFRTEADDLIRLAAGAFDPLAGPAPSGVIPAVEEAALPQSSDQYWIVQVRDERFPEAIAAIETAGGEIDGFIHDSAYMVRATPAEAASIRQSEAVRWAGYYQPSWRVPAAANGLPGLLDLAGPQTYRVYLFREQDAAGVVQALGGIAGASVGPVSGPVIEVQATALQVPAIASIAEVQWVTVRPEAVLLNSEARWVTDTGIRDLLHATAPGRLTGAGQTAAVADTGINYTYDMNGNAHVAFRDCDAAGVCKEAIYTQEEPGIGGMFDIVNNDTAHRKMVAYFDLGETGPHMYDESSHGTHTGGSVSGDQGSNGVADGDDGMAPGAGHVHQNIGTGDGGLAVPLFLYDLFQQAYRPRNPGSVAVGSPSAGNPVDPSPACSDPATGTSACYRPREDARTHNNSWGLVVPLVDASEAAFVDEFVWDHEDMVIVFSAGNGGPGPGTIITPSVGKNDFSSGASANGRQPMVSIDSMASFSSHGPTGDGRLGVDLATPGQVIVSSKGGTVDGYHVAQGTSMSAPVLTGLSTLVRQYFFDGYAAAGGDGFAGGAPDAGRVHNPSSALVKATMVNGAVRMRGWYTGADGARRALDGQWPSEGQGFGRVNLENSLYFTGDATNNWYHDVWRRDTEAFSVSGVAASRSYSINVQPGAPFDVTLAWTDPPDLLPAGTPAVINNLDLIVRGPDGSLYFGNNFNSRLDPSVAVAETPSGPAAPDVRNPVERVRIADPEAGVYTVTVRADPVAVGRQGFALAASGEIAAPGETFTPGPGLQTDSAGAPTISDVVVTGLSSDAAKVTFSTSEATTAAATLTLDGAQVTFVDSYNVGASGFPGLNEGNVETSAEYGDRPVLSTAHEILITGLDPGAAYNISLAATDLGGNRSEAGATHISPSTIYAPDAPDTAQLQQGAAPGWRTGTQMYAGHFGGNRLSGAFMFRIPEGAINPADITGAVVETTTSHDWVVRYTDDPLLFVDLLGESVEATWGTQSYDQVHAADADARFYPETAYKRGDYQKLGFALRCSELDALKQTLLTTTNGERRAAFRYEAGEVTDGIFSMEFGFNRRSRGPEMRPRLLLFTGIDNPYAASGCDAGSAAPALKSVGIHDGERAGSVSVSWETDIPSDSMVLFREQGTQNWIQVGNPARSTIHQVQVFNLDRAKKYEFVVRSAACNRATTTDTNGGEGYAFFAPDVPQVRFYFHGTPLDQESKFTGPGTATFDGNRPTESIPDSQTAAWGAIVNKDFAGNPLAAYWRAPFSGTIDADVDFSWYWSTSASRAIFGQTLEVFVFADADPDTGEGTLIGHGTMEVGFGPTPTVNTGSVHVSGAVQRELLIQVVPVFGVTSEALFVHYDSVSTPSSFGWLLGDPGPTSGPVPPPSAGASGLVAPPTRPGEATFSDVHYGTCTCAIPDSRPDLRVSPEDITFAQQRVKSGDRVSITAVLHNDGQSDASNVVVRFDDTGAQIGTVTVPTIAAGGSATVSVPWDTRGIRGDRTITVTADPEGIIDEADETNNSASVIVNVKGNKVRNGSFEQSSDGSKPDNWSSSGGTSYRKTGGSDGERSVQADSTGSWTSDPIAVEAGRTYGVSVDIAGGPGTLLVEQLTATGAVAVSTTKLLPVSADGVFSSVELVATMAPGVTEVRVTLLGPLAGTATFDNVWLWEE